MTFLNDVPDDSVEMKVKISKELLTKDLQPIISNNDYEKYPAAIDIEHKLFGNMDIMKSSNFNNCTINIYNNH